MRLLLTRPLADAEPMRRALTALGHGVTSEPLLAVTFLSFDPTALIGMQASIFTSGNAVRALAGSPACHELQGLPSFAVGGATAERLRELGFTRIVTGPGRAADLVPLIAAGCSPAAGPLLHLAGDKFAFDLAPPLAARGFALRRHVVYRTDPAPLFSIALRQLLINGALDGVILMSPETTRVYVELVARHGLEEATRDLVYFCLSPAVSAPLSALGPARIKIAATPDRMGLLALLGGPEPQ